MMKRVRAAGEIVAFALLLAVGAFTAYEIVHLPPTIATHFAGPSADAYGSKWSLLGTFVPAVALYALVSVVAFLPVRAMNLTVRVTEANEAAVRAAVLAMLAWMKASVVAVFAWIDLMMAASAGGALSPWFPLTFALGPAPLVLLAIFLPAIARAGGEPGRGA